MAERFYVIATTGFSRGRGPRVHTSYAVLDRAYAHREVGCFYATARDVDADGHYVSNEKRRTNALDLAAALNRAYPVDS